MYSVAQYLKMLTLAGRSPLTVAEYRSVLTSYAQFLEVPLPQLHKNLNTGDLIDYTEHRKNRSEKGNRTHLSIILRFFKMNGVTIDELERAVLVRRPYQPHNDKPLTTEKLRLMMDLADPHGKAILCVLVSTGIRARELCQLKLSDIDGDRVILRNEICKNQRGGVCYLTSEAREFLDAWLLIRDAYLRRSRTKFYSKNIPVDDDRLFCVAYPSLRRIFARLYKLTDGERGKYGDRVTIHSTRRYFRSNAVKTIPLDIVEFLMRHGGYLTDSYRRIPENEARRAFHDGESALYITRPLNREQLQELDDLRSRMRGLETLFSNLTSLEKINLKNLEV